MSLPQAAMGSFAGRKRVEPTDVQLLAMQKVEDSSPFSRFEERPAARAFPCLPAGSTHRAGRDLCWPVANWLPNPPAGEQCEGLLEGATGEAFSARALRTLDRYARG
jgi:hypothetical protein